MERRLAFPLGAAVTVQELDRDPHPVHHRLRTPEPVSWLPALDGWLVTDHALALIAMRDAETYTVDDPRFTTARVIGPSMLSLDGVDHDRHRGPFTAPFRVGEVKQRFTGPAAELATHLTTTIRPQGTAELRRGFAGPMAAAIVTEALGMDPRETGEVLGWYDAIVASVTALSSGESATAEGTIAYDALRGRLQPIISGSAGDSLLATAAHGDGLSGDEIASNAAVLLFGGIETTEGMIASALHAVLSRPGERERILEDPTALDGALDESLRLEPAAAVIDRYATRDATLGRAEIAAGELVRISITGANRDPAVFPDPDGYDPTRSNARRHLAFAQGPHVCVGVHLARLEARAAITEILRLPGLRLDPDHPVQTRGLVFRKPLALHARWDVARPQLG